MVDHVHRELKAAKRFTFVHFMRLPSWLAGSDCESALRLLELRASLGEHDTRTLPIMILGLDRGRGEVGRERWLPLGKASGAQFNRALLAQEREAAILGLNEAGPVLAMRRRGGCTLLLFPYYYFFGGATCCRVRV